MYLMADGSRKLGTVCEQSVMAVLVEAGSLEKWFINRGRR
jgi:hypothetical protein